MYGRVGLLEVGGHPFYALNYQACRTGLIAVADVTPDFRPSAPSVDDAGSLFQAVKLFRRSFGDCGTSTWMADSRNCHMSGGGRITGGIGRERHIARLMYR